MKTISDMNYDEIQQELETFLKGHEIEDVFDMNFFTFKTFVTLSTSGTDRFDALYNTLYDIFKCGFMSGYLQSETQK